MRLHILVRTAKGKRKELDWRGGYWIYDRRTNGNGEGMSIAQTIGDVNVPSIS